MFALALLSMLAVVEPAPPDDPLVLMGRLDELERRVTMEVEPSVEGLWREVMLHKGRLEDLQSPVPRPDVEWTLRPATDPVIVEAEHELERLRRDFKLAVVVGVVTGVFLLVLFLVVAFHAASAEDVAQLKGELSVLREQLKK